MDKQRQIILRIFQEKLRKGESLETLTLKDIMSQINTELAHTEKAIKTANKEFWECYKCHQTFDYCWCNPNVN